jgi:gluconokinase
MVRVLALDVGTSSVRARVYDETGAPEEGAEAQTRYDTAELDPDRLVEAARAAVAEVRGEARGPIDAVACSCFWHSLLALDGRGRRVSPFFTWLDTRAAAQAEHLARELGEEAIHARTGCYPHPSYWPAVLLWLREERPQIFREAARFVSFADYLYLRLVGEAKCTVSMASATGLLDVARCDWDDELVRFVGVDRDRLPAIGDESVGEDVPWFPPLGDGACANLGSGAVGAERAALTVGTSGAYRVLVDRERRPRRGLFLYRLDASRLVEGGAVSDGGNLFEWLRQTLRIDDQPPLAEPDAHGLTFLPLLGGERAPGWKAAARGALAGLSFDTTPAEIAQAALEGIAYRIGEIADLMPEVREVIAGGGALVENAEWAQVFADVLDLPVTLTGAVESSARGAAVAALERLGYDPPPPPAGATLQPRAERTAAYRAARDRQRALYDALN